MNEIKVGSRWCDKHFPRAKATVIKYQNDTVYYLFYSDLSDGLELDRSTESFLEVYEPVYIVEGFEV